MDFKSKSLQPLKRRSTVYKQINDKISSKKSLYIMLGVGLLVGIALSVSLGIYLPKLEEDD
tara:strand:+ start:2488 stop:2670 length:183 start_codon:yes stop_codon:yes gene_type:complete